MCLSTVYRAGEAVSPDSILAEYVVAIDVDEHTNVVRLRDITGERSEYRGRLRSVDLVKNQAFLDLENAD